MCHCSLNQLAMGKNVYFLRQLGFIFLFCFTVPSIAFAQFENAAKKEKKAYQPLTLKLNEEGSHYLRFIMWHQIWMTTNNLGTDAKLQVTPSIRRSRVLAYAQISPRFLILTHFGLNNFTPGNLTSLGNNGDAPQFFLHDAWGEIKITDELYVGAGLHYWKGLTRLANASTLNFMTLDQIRPWAHWHSFGVTDQFARHFGVYAKGKAGKFDYRIAVNAPGRNPIDDGKNYGLTDAGLTYTGVTNPDVNGNPTGNTIVEGYFRYNFWDQEANKLPYEVGSYLGEKKILGIGSGFFLHPNGMYHTANGRHGNVSHFAVDAFMEYPYANGNMIHAYASYISMNYGENYVSRWGGTGTNLYAQFGYFLKTAKLMPYLAYQNGNYEGFDKPISTLDIGVNYYIRGHNCKITLEYSRINADIREAAIPTQNDVLNQLRMQLHVFL